MGVPSISIQWAQVCWGWRTSASFLLSTNAPFLSLGSLAIFYCLFSFWGAPRLPLVHDQASFFFKFGMACRSRSVGGGGGGRTTGGCILGASFKLPPLFLLANRPFKPDLFFGSIASSSSSNSESIWAMPNCFGWMEERLEDSVSELEISTGPSSSTKRNWSISSFRNSRGDAISFFAAIVASRETCCNGITSEGGIWWMGSLIGGRLSRAKNLAYPRISCPDGVAYLLKDLWNRFKVQNQMNSSQ